MDMKIKLFITAQIAVIIVFAVLALNCSSTQSTPSSYSGGGQTSSYTSGRYNYERQIANSKSNNNSPYSSNQGSYAQQSSHSNSNTYNSSNANSQYSTSGTLNSIFGKSKEKKQKQETSKAPAKENDDIEIVCLGSGSNHTDAVKMALRSAIEQAYGTFVSSNTKLLNDKLVADEIVSISSGNIKHYDILSEAQVGNQWNVTVKAMVSTGKLTSFVKAKGGSTELSCSNFTMNVRLEKMNEDAERIVLRNLIQQCNEMLKYALDYRLTAGNPVVSANGNYYVLVDVDYFLNENFFKCKEYIVNTINSIKLNNADRAQRQNMGLPVYYTKIGDDVQYYLRTNSLNKKDTYIGNGYTLLEGGTLYFNFDTEFTISNGTREKKYKFTKFENTCNSCLDQVRQVLKLRSYYDFYMPWEILRDKNIPVFHCNLPFDFISLDDMEKTKKIELIPDSEHFKLYIKTDNLNNKILN